MRKLFAALGLSVALAAPFAHAEATGIHIPVTQAQLATQESVATLYEDIEFAAKRACHAQLAGSILEHYDRRACRKETMDQAIRNSGIGPLISYHDARLEAPAIETATLASR